jgi:hypothetical protein
MNVIEIEEAVSQLFAAPFDPAEFPFSVHHRIRREEDHR